MMRKRWLITDAYLDYGGTIGYGVGSTESGQPRLDPVWQYPLAFFTALTASAAETLAYYGFVSNYIDIDYLAGVGGGGIILWRVGNALKDVATARRDLKTTRMIYGMESRLERYESR